MHINREVVMNMISYEPWTALRTLRDDVNRALAGTYGTGRRMP